MTSTGPEQVAARERAFGASAGHGSANVRFFTCVAILLVSAVSMQAVANAFGQYFRKLPVDLRLPLAAFDTRKLSPEYGLYRISPAPISEETLKAMGTEEYAQLRLVDLSKESSDPAWLAHLFVTYYTGQPDMVPHVPDECYQAGGYTLLERSTTHVDVPSVGAKDDRLPVRLLGFEQKSEGLFSAARGTDNGRVYVLYFFLTNGRFVTTRNQVRVQTANLTQRYAYFAKFEVKFTSDTGKAANESESLAAMQKLMRTVLPVFLGDHFADWEALQSAAEG